MKILLINPFTGSGATAGRYRRFLSPMPPISLAYVAAALENADIDMAVYDDYTCGGDRKLLFDFLENSRPDAVGLTCVTPTASRTYEICREIRQVFPRMYIILGNIHPSVFYESILHDDIADIVVHGEAEESLPETIKAIEGGDDLRAVRGISFRENGKVITTDPHPYINNLDTIPFPAWHLFPRNRYRIFNFATVKNPGTLILGSRGCPYRCTFCSLKIMGTKRRARSPKNIVDEFEFLYEKYGYVQPSFIDPIFPFSKKEGIAFSNEMIARGLHQKMIWITETRVDHVDEELLTAMSAAGLRRIMYGFEVGSEQAMEKIQKRATINDARIAVEQTRRAGIQIIGFFMLGVPGDTLKTIEQTIRLAASLDIDFAKFTVFSPFPGTQAYDDLLKEGKIHQTYEWERFTNYPTRKNPPIYLPDSLTTNDIVRSQKRAFVKFYLRPKMIFHHLFRVRTLGLRDFINGVLTLFQG
ncbi:MAG: radical SAM protein [bacterium]